jgi:predicted amidophosphoribosyltransferase
MLRCDKCGNYLTEWEKYCDVCGNDVDTDSRGNVLAAIGWVRHHILISFLAVVILYLIIIS